MPARARSKGEAGPSRSGAARKATKGALGDDRPRTCAPRWVTWNVRVMKVVDPRPLDVPKRHSWGPVAVYADVRDRTEGKCKAPSPSAAGFRGRSRVGYGKVGLVNSNSHHLCLM